MPKTLEDVKSALKELAEGNDLVEVVSSLALDAESKKKSFDALNSTHNKIVGELKSIGFAGGDTTAATTFLNELKSKLESAQELQASLSEKEEKVSGSQAEIQELKKSIARMENAMAADKAEAAKAKQALLNRSIKDAITPKMKDRIFSYDLRAEKLIESGKVAMDESGNIVFKNGDEVMDIDKGLEAYFNEPSNKDDLKNTQLNGGGTSGGSGRSNAKLMKMDDFKKLDVKAQYKFFKEGGDVID